MKYPLTVCLVRMGGERMNVKDKIIFGFILIIGVGILVSSIWGNYKLSQYKSECTAEVIVTDPEVTEHEYLWAPYHGGVVTKHHYYLSKYTVEIDGNKYWVILRSNNVASKGCIGLYKYNPDDPSHGYFDMSEICGNDYIQAYTTVFAAVN